MKRNKKGTQRKQQEDWNKTSDRELKEENKMTEVLFRIIQGDCMWLRDKKI